MTEQEQDQAAEALIQWFRSQEIAPADGIEVMARAIIVATASLVQKKDPQGLATHSDLKALREGVGVVNDLITETLEEMLSGKFMTRKRGE